jgi:hypothetical protein
MASCQRPLIGGSPVGVYARWEREHQFHKVTLFFQPFNSVISLSPPDNSFNDRWIFIRFCFDDGNASAAPGATCNQAPSHAQQFGDAQINPQAPAVGKPVPLVSIAAQHH